MAAAPNVGSSLSAARYSASAPLALAARRNCRVRYALPADPRQLLRSHELGRGLRERVAVGYRLARRRHGGGKFGGPNANIPNRIA
jgi:hypothetical protein